MEWMLDFCPDARLQMLRLFCQAPQLVLGPSLAFGALHGICRVSRCPVDRLEDLARDPIGFEQVAELQKRCGIRWRLRPQINVDKSPDGLAIVDRISMSLSDKPKHC